MSGDASATDGGSLAPLEVAGSVAVVTGGANGIGRGIVRALLEALRGEEVRSEPRGALGLSSQVRVLFVEGVEVA